jgi:hypothetical protein
MLSMMPDEPIKTTTGKPGTLYLGDIHSFGGNSGSLVFVDIAGIKPDGTIKLNDYRFLGVLSGYYYEGADFSLHIETTLNGKLAANSNVSMIVPTECVKDLIVNNAELEALRSKQ